MINLLDNAPNQSSKFRTKIGLKKKKRTHVERISSQCKRFRCC